MLKNYFKTAVRSLQRNRMSTALNIFGLSIGVGAALLLILSIQQELSYDKFYQDTDRIYRVYIKTPIDGGKNRSSIDLSGLLGPLLVERIPEIEVMGRSSNTYPVLKLGDKKFNESLNYADPGLIDILEVQFIEGSKISALETPNSIVLTESLALKFFDDPHKAFGKQLHVSGQLMEITGIVKDLPRNSHYFSKGFISMSTMKSMSWKMPREKIYVKLRTPNHLESTQSIFNEIAEEYMTRITDETNEIQEELSFYPIKDIHLSEDPGQRGRGNKKFVISFSIIAFFILLIASINYVNLATAQSMKRVKEIGMRKVIGARRKELIFQFLIESIVISFISVLLGGFMAEMGSGLYNSIAWNPIEIDFLSNPLVISTLLGFAIFTGLLAGLYPALYLSSFKPTDIFKGGNSKGSGSKNFRRILVSIQFVISIGLIISTLIVYKQLHFINHKDLGYNKKQLIHISLNGVKEKTAIKQRLSNLARIEAMATTNIVPASGDLRSFFEISNGEGVVSTDMIRFGSIDHDYLDVMQMKIVQGRNFSKAIESDTKAVIVNETLVKKYGWKNPLGKTILTPSTPNSTEQKKFTVIGIVEDFNMQSLYDPVHPFIFFLYPEFSWGGNWIMARINMDHEEQTLDDIKYAYEEIEKDFPIKATFVDDYLNLIYRKEAKRGETYLFFSGLTIAIACIGLFGLVAFILQQKIKEISIRKVLGASVKDIIGLVSKEFVLIIILATIIASPLAYYYLQNWLNSFEYRISIGVNSFISAGVASLAIALLTIGVQSLKVARTNPAETLKCE